MKRKIQTKNKANKKNRKPKIYRRLKTAWNVFSTIATIAGALFPYRTGDSSTQSILNQSGVVNAPEVLGESNSQTNNFNFNYSPFQPTGCDYVCNDFTDLSEWIIHPNLEIISTFPFQVRALANEKQRGGIMFLKDKWFEPGYNATLTVTPCGTTQSNVVFSYGDQFQYIIGDAGYDRVAVKSGDNYIAPLGNTAQHFTLANSIKPCSEFTVHIVVTSKGPYSLSVKSTLTYTASSGQFLSETPIPEFVVPTTVYPWTIQDNIGVGLWDWQKVGNVSAIFKSLVIDKPLISK